MSLHEKLSRRTVLKGIAGLAATTALSTLPYPIVAQAEVEPSAEQKPSLSAIEVNQKLSKIHAQIPDQQSKIMAAVAYLDQEYNANGGQIGYEFLPGQPLPTGLWLIYNNLNGLVPEKTGFMPTIEHIPHFREQLDENNQLFGVGLSVVRTLDEDHSVVIPKGAEGGKAIRLGSSFTPEQYLNQVMEFSFDRIKQEITPSSPDDLTYIEKRVMAMVDYCNGLRYAEGQDPNEFGKEVSVENPILTEGSWLFFGNAEFKPGKNDLLTQINDVDGFRLGSFGFQRIDIPQGMRVMVDPQAEIDNNGFAIDLQKEFQLYFPALEA